jgi:hypothetical protein
MYMYAIRKLRMGGPWFYGRHLFIPCCAEAHRYERKTCAAPKRHRRMRLQVVPETYTGKAESTICVGVL